MRKFIETTGRCEEDAIAAALFQLGLDRDDVSVEVLQRPKNGFLGFGSNPAKVRVSYEVEGEDETPVPMPKESTSAPRAEEVPAPKAGKKQEDGLQPDDEIIIAKDAPVPAPADDAKAQQIHQFLTGLMTHLEVNAVPEISVTETGYQVVLQGENLGAIIGRRGETLDAIQQLTNYSVNRSQSKRVRIHIDAEGYRAKREEALQRLAVKVAGKVVKYRKNVTLEVMNAYERHVIHSALQEYPDVTTYSTGTEPNRRTVVVYSPGEHR